MKLVPVALLWSIALTVSAAEETPWINLLANDKIDAFTGKPDNWKFAKSVTLNSENAKKLSFEAGSGILINGEKGNAADLYTKEKFGDLEVKVEFMIPKGSNSGIKFHGHYEIQICDSFGKPADKLQGDDCGGVYPRAELTPKYHHIDTGIAPLVNACQAPGTWQTLRVVFIAPRFDAEGKKTANARIEIAELNGKVIHQKLELKTPTGHNHTKPEMKVGSFMIQGDHGPVAFKTLQVRPLK